MAVRRSCLHRTYQRRMGRGRGKFLCSTLVARRPGGFAALEPLVLIVGLNSVAVMGEAAEPRCCDLGAAEYRRPFAKRQDVGNDNRSLLVELADEVEQQFAA